MSTVLNRSTKEYLTRAEPGDYPVEQWAHDPDMSPVQGIEEDLWLIDGDVPRLKTSLELDAEITYWRDKAKEQLFVAVNEYGSAHYSPTEQSSIKSAKNEAAINDLTNRFAYLKLATDWEDIVFLDYATRRAGVLSSTTYAGVQLALGGLDFSNNDATDPLVTVSGYKVIPD